MAEEIKSDTWLLAGALVAQGPESASRLDVGIEDGRICSLQGNPLYQRGQQPVDCWGYPDGNVPCRSRERHPPTPFQGGITRPPIQLDVSGMLILPGLINAHDHLEFALFPRMGNRVYPNAKQWALDIYHPDQAPLREILRIPKPTRLFWGGLKNLLSGVTTVCNHNRYEPGLHENHFPVKVLKRFGWSHSFDFSQDPGADFMATPAGAPFFIHLAEGTDEQSRKELDRLDRLGLLGEQTVIIHGVALTPVEWELVRKRSARLVWCPSSNLFTLGRTLEGSLLRSEIQVALGNDSPLTAAGDLLDEIHCATQFEVPLDLVYKMVTQSAARLMRLEEGEGEIVEGGIADLVLMKDTGLSPAQRLTQLGQTDIEGVMVKGKVMLASGRIASQLPKSVFERMQKLFSAQREYLVAVDLLPHWRETSRILGENFRLAGKEIQVFS